MVKRNDGPAKGSFGIPDEMHEQVRKAQEKKDTTKQGDEKPPVESTGEDTDFGSKPIVEGEEDKDSEDTNPVKILEKLGAKFGQNEFQHLLFKGFYESELPVVGTLLKATFRTLSGKDYEELDETLAEETKMVEMTGQGFEVRRSLLVIAYGVTHLNGKAVCKPQYKNPKDPSKGIDTKKLAAARKEVFNKMHPGTVNMIIKKHGAMTMALNLIVESPDEHLKNS